MEDGYTLKNFIITILILAPIFILLGFLEIGLISDEFIDSNIGWLAFGYIIIGSIGGLVRDYMEYLHSGVLLSANTKYFLIEKAESHFKFLYVTTSIFIGMGSIPALEYLLFWDRANDENSLVTLLGIPIFLAAMIGALIVVYYCGRSFHYLFSKYVQRASKERLLEVKQRLLNYIKKDSKLADMTNKLNDKKHANRKLFEYNQKHYNRTLELAKRVGLDDLDFYLIEDDLKVFFTNNNS